MPKTPALSPKPTEGAKRRARTILARLKHRYPDVATALAFMDPWQLLVATVMSAQTTDDNVNRITPILFSQYPTVADLAAANPEDIERIIYSAGFYRQKTKSIIKLSAALSERFDGVVPNDLDQLVSLPGVGRKTASVVLTEAFARPAIAVDTHVRRVAGRLNLTQSSDPVRIEMDLRVLYPKREWVGISMRFIQFGRDICDAQRPLCRVCELNRICRWPGKNLSGKTLRR